MAWKGLNVEGLHNAYLNSLQKNNRLYEFNAKIIGNYLYQIKKYVNQLQQLSQLPDEFPYKEIKIEQLKLKNQIIDELVTRTNNILKGVKGRRFEKNKLFYRSHNFTRKHEISDDIHEEEIAAFFVGLQDYLKGKGINESSSLKDSGFLQGKSNVSVNEIMDKTVSNTMEYTSNKIKQSINSINYSKNQTLKFKEKTGKIDVAINIQLSENTQEIDKILQQLYNACKNATFTIKNYSSFSQNTDLGLGKTMPEKALSGSLNWIQENTIFFRGNENKKYWYFKYFNSVANKDKHYSHLIFGYELMGLGQIYDNQTSKTADYIIYNDPNSSNIFVKSTRSIAYDLISNNKMIVSPKTIKKTTVSGQT